MIQLSDNTRCLSLDIITKSIKKKSFLVEIYIKNNKEFDIFDVVLMSNVPIDFEYISKTLCIDDLPFYDFEGVKKLHIDNLYVDEEIKISYELKGKEEIKFNYLDIEFVYRDNNYEVYSEFISKEIDKGLFYEEMSEESKRLKVIKRASSSTAIVSEIIEYEISIENISRNFIKNIEVVDIQKKDVEILGEYIYLNNKEIEVATLSKGVYIKGLEKNQKAFIKFKARILEKGENSEISNKIRVSYDYEFKDVTMFYTEEFESERVKIYDANLDIKKTVNKEAIGLGEELDFRIDIKNMGDVDCYSVSLYEMLSDEIEFIVGSFYKEKENINIGKLENGINIGNLLKGEHLTLYYKVLVKKICSTGYINSQISADFKYKCDMKSPIKYLKISEKDFKIEAINPGFTEFEIENVIDMKSDDIEIIDISQDIEIDDNYVVKTATGKSIDGIIMNQYKVVILGYLNVYVEYSENRECEEIYIYKDRVRFVEEIVLAFDYSIGTGINIRGSSKNIYLKKLKNGKILYKNSNLIEAIVKEF